VSQRLLLVEQKSQSYRQELAQVKRELLKAQQEGAEHKQATDSSSTYIHVIKASWMLGTVVERTSLTDKLSLS